VDIDLKICKNCRTKYGNGLELAVKLDDVTTYIYCMDCFSRGPEMASTIQRELELLAEVWNKANETTTTNGE